MNIQNNVSGVNTNQDDTLIIETYKKMMPEQEANIPVHNIPTKVKGFADLSPEQQIVFSKWKKIVEETYEMYGFNPLDVPPFVHRKFLLTKGGVDAQIFSVNHLSDNSMTKYGIAFDRTVPFALWVREHQNEIVFPYKRYDVNLSYRAETTKTGRLNGFYQADVDIVGKDLPLSCDAECITTLITTLSKLDIPPFYVYINHIEIPKSLIKNAGFKQQDLALRIIDKLDKTPKEDIQTELLQLEPGISPKAIMELVEICSFRGTLNEFIETVKVGNEEIKYLEQIKTVLSFIKISGVDTSVFKFAPGIVRGLDYYTGIVFETFLMDYPQFGSITSGGRYDELVDSFSEKSTNIKGVGGSIGLSRLFQILLSKGKITNQIKTASKILILIRDAKFLESAYEIARRLREKNIQTEMYSGEIRGLKNQLQFANNVLVPFALMVMENKTYVIRDLTKSQQTEDIYDPTESVEKAQKIIQFRNKGLTIYTFSKKQEIDLGHTRVFTIEDFISVINRKKTISLDESSAIRLDETREFVNYLLKNQIKVYGLTTGFADLRDKSVSASEASQLSSNILLSHDAAIGESLDLDIIRGAMVLRANALSKGYSGFERDSLQTLISMINADIIPEIPSTGSLGASGDLALLARLGRAMQGSSEVQVYVKNEKMTAKQALEKFNIKPFNPTAKEGLALTNGTSFMASALAVAYTKQLHLYENIFALINLYLSATHSIDAAFNASIQRVRKQEGQEHVADIIRSTLQDSPLIDQESVQDDYSQRCIPQIFGPKIEDFLHLSSQVFNELDAVTDNPLIFRNNEISPDVSKKRIISYKDQNWTVLSGGNFHGEVIAKTADELVAFNPKIALTLERHLTFLNNPARNKGQFPSYLIENEKKIGLQSGFMIPQYVANALTQKICSLANPVTNFNLTSANESEDIVSYGNSATEKLLHQLKLMEQLSSVYLVCVSQAYSITKRKYEEFNGKLNPNIISEKLFNEVQSFIHFPINQDVSFDALYKQMTLLLQSGKFREIIDRPLEKKLGIHV